MKQTARLTDGGRILLTLKRVLTVVP